MRIPTGGVREPQRLILELRWWYMGATEAHFGAQVVVYAFRLISIEMHTSMSRQQCDLLYTLGEEVPKLVYTFLMCKPV